MNVMETFSSFLRKLDRLSPYPCLYPFIMSDNEKIIFDAAIKTSKYYLEFGLGGSTLRAIQKSKTIIYTVESSSEWIGAMRKYIALRRSEGARLHIFKVEIGPTRAWGYPVSNDFEHSYESYSSDVFRLVDRRILDLALVDGRFRVACTLKLIMACHENIIFRIMIHDFWNRPDYQVVLKYLDVIDKADTIGIFSIKKGVDFNSVRKDYETYKLIPT